MTMNPHPRHHLKHHGHHYHEKQHTTTTTCEVFKPQHPYQSSHSNHPPQHLHQQQSVDPNYPYHHPYTSSYTNQDTDSNTNNANSTPNQCNNCPHCQSPPSHFHTDPTSADLICTSCGAVLDHHLLSSTAEWRDFGTEEDLARGNAPGSKARCGGVESVVDETRWVGGLMPTTLSKSAFNGGILGGGRGGSSRYASFGGNTTSITAEDMQKMSSLRRRLKRTHNMIENMVEKEHQRQFREVCLEGEVRSAKLARGEEAMEAMNTATRADGLAVESQGDFEAQAAEKRKADLELEQQQLQLQQQQQSLKRQKQLSSEDQFTALKDKKWSLTEAILLHGTCQEAQQFVDIRHRRAPFATSETDSNVGSSPSNEWTHSSHQNEQLFLQKKLDAATRSSTHKLYCAFTLLYRAAYKLEFHGMADRTFREAIGWLVRFAVRRDGLRVKGISGMSGKEGIGRGSTGGGGTVEESLCLSLIPSVGGEDGTPIFFSPSKSTSKSKSASKSSSSLATDFQRIRQYASLGAAVLYLSAKHTGVGRTLAEVCSAFGTFSFVSSPQGEGGTTGIAASTATSSKAEPLVRPKHCSRAMQELRMALPEVVAGGHGMGGLGGTASLSLNSAMKEDHSVASAVGSMEGVVSAQMNGASVAEGVTSASVVSPVKVESSTTGNGAEMATPSNLSKDSVPISPAPDVSLPTPVKSEFVPPATSTTNSSSHPNLPSTTEEAALSDLTTRMASSLNLPSFATSAAVAVAVQCARDAHASQNNSASKNRIRGSATNTRLIRPNIRSRRKRDRQNMMQQEQISPEVVAASSLLLVCLAGGTMQRLAKQALIAAKESNSVNAVSSRDKSAPQSVEGVDGEDLTPMMNPLDDLHDEVLFSEDQDNGVHASSPTKAESAQTTPESRNAKTTRAEDVSDLQSKRQTQTQSPSRSRQESMTSWNSWSNQPHWHREVAQIEQCTGVSRQSIISYYSNMVHPRRSHFLGVAKQNLESGEHSEMGGSGAGVGKTQAYFLRNISAAAPLMSLRQL